MVTGVGSEPHWPLSILGIYPIIKPASLDDGRPNSAWQHIGPYGVGVLGGHPRPLPREFAYVYLHHLT